MQGATNPYWATMCSVRRVSSVVLAEPSALLSSPSLRHQMALELGSLTFAAPQQPQPGGHSSNTAFNTKQNIESPKRTCTFLFLSIVVNNIYLHHFSFCFCLIVSLESLLASLLIPLYLIATNLRHTTRKQCELCYCAFSDHPGPYLISEEIEMSSILQRTFVTYK